jgi:serine-type D-Ala-D-Ala carboxypeptidase (penicillin-binding protein 5/6)
MRWVSGTAVVLLVLGVGTRLPVVAASGERQPATILIDADTGRSLREVDADAPRPPGSLSQLMLLLVSLEQAELGLLRLQVPVTLSPAAVNTGTGGFRVPLRADRAYLLSDLLKAVAVASATDAAVAVAEATAGSVAACVDLMNTRAQRLGMRATRYASPGAIDGSAAAETTTARDLARLGQALLHHPAVLEWASASGVPFDEGAVVLRNGNQLLGAVPGVDGLQVSAARASQGTSYSVVATARRGALRLVAVVLDAPDTATRYSTAAELLEWGFAHYERIEVIRQGEPLNLPVRVLHGSVPQLTPVAGQTLSLLRQRGDERNLQLRYQVPAAVDAPVKRHQAVGEVIVEEKGQLIAVIPMLSPTSVAASGVLAVEVP